MRITEKVFRDRGQRSRSYVCKFVIAIIVAEATFKHCGIEARLLICIIILKLNFVTGGYKVYTCTELVRLYDKFVISRHKSIGELDTSLLH